MASSTELTPQERLAISRKAIVRHMNRHHREIENRGDDEDLDVSGDLRPASYSKLSMMKHALRIWWHRHPASAALELSRPVLYDYASAHPFKLLGISAVAGAALVVIQPWRRISVGGVLGTALKSSGLSSALVSMLYSVSHRPEKTNPP